MRKAIFWLTVAAGATAAYLMYRKGEPIGTIAKRTLTHPIGSLVDELRGGAQA